MNRDLRSTFSCALAVLLLSGTACAFARDPESVKMGAKTYRISGTVSGDSVAGIALRLTGDKDASATTDASGKFSFTGVQNGNYTITASRSGFTFQPQSIAVTVQDADVAGQSFTCAKNQTPTYVISGTVSGDATSGVTITLTGDAVASVKTDASGSFSFTVQSGNYTIAASLSGYVFQPASIAVTVQDADVAGRSFTSLKNQASTCVISGTVSGDATWGVTISLTGRQTATATTDTSGNFSFVVANGSYKLTAAKPGFIFAPPSITFSVSGSNVTGKNFTSTAKLTSISGTVSGLATSSSLMLRLNDVAPFKIIQNGPFTLPVGLTKGTSYAVSVSTQPTNPTQLCTVRNDWGVADGTDVADVAVTCDTLTSIVAANDHTCALTTGGAVICWGDLASQPVDWVAGSVCANSDYCSMSPKRLEGFPQVKALAAGFAHTCAITMSNGAVCWGLNFDGALGSGSVTSSQTPVTVLDGKGVPISDVVRIAAGVFYSCTVSASGATKCWGANDYGQLGAASSDWYDNEPCSTVALDVIASGITDVAAGSYHTCALTAAGGVKCWGWNSVDQLGAATTTACGSGGRYICGMAPLDVPDLTGVTAVQVGFARTCAITSTGVSCWGSNSNGQLGNSTIDSKSIMPVPVQDLPAVSALSVGVTFSCALLSDGTGRVACWGQDDSGQLGSSLSGMLSYSAAPMLVPSVSGATSIATGWAHACALTPNSGVLCWGSNTKGQLGHVVDPSSTSTVGPVGY